MIPKNIKDLYVHLLKCDEWYVKEQIREGDTIEIVLEYNNSRCLEPIFYPFPKGKKSILLIPTYIIGIEHLLKRTIESWTQRVRKRERQCQKALSTYTA